MCFLIKKYKATYEIKFNEKIIKVVLVEGILFFTLELLL